MKKSNQNSYITSWGLQQSISQKIPTTERLRLYKHWKRYKELMILQEIIKNEKLKLKI